MRRKVSFRLHDPAEHLINGRPDPGMTSPPGMEFTSPRQAMDLTLAPSCSRQFTERRIISILTHAA